MIGCTSMCSAQARVYFGNMIMTSCPSLRNSDLKFASNDRCRFGIPNFIPYEWWNVLGITYMKKWDEISAVKAKKNLLEPKQDSVFIWGRTGSFLKPLRSKKCWGWREGRVSEKKKGSAPCEKLLQRMVTGLLWLEVLKLLDIFVCVQ